MKLHNYQQRCADFIEAHARCILSVDMGLGKTAACLEYIRRANPRTLCIVAPKRVALNNWHTEAEKWGLEDIRKRCVVVAGTKAKRAAALADDAHPYKIVSRDNVAEVAGRCFDVLIIDELTSFKNVQSKRTKAVCSIQAAHKIGLTGTFLANGAIDIYGQAAAVGLSQALGANFWAWRATYFRDILRGAGLAFEKWQLSRPLADVLAPIAPHVFTLTAADYLEIPPVTETTHPVELDPETRAAYDDAEAFLGFQLRGATLSVKEGAKFAKLQTLCNGFVYLQNEHHETIGAQRGHTFAKLEAVADFVADCKDAGEPVLLFYAFREEALLLSELLDARGVKYESVSRAGFLDRWNAGQIECLFAHPASAGHGLNLQHGGRVVVWSSLTYNYEYFAQANARLARQGQKRNVQIHYFVAARTCEERVTKALHAKDKEQKAFLELTK